MELLIEKLPHGNTWWTFSNDKIIQSETENEEKPYIIQVCNEVSIEKNINEKKKVVKKVIKKDNLFEFIILSIDELSSLYTENMKRDAKSMLKEELKTFINDASFKKLFISSKLRILMSWLNENRIDIKNLYVIKQFVNWFLSKEVLNDDENELKYIDNINELYIVKKS